MKLFSQEHYALLAQFEREHRGRTDKEDKSLWPKGIIYQDGHMNELFAAYLRGHAYAVADMRSDIQNLEVAAQKADEVECGCGDIYPADSYGAGFIDALGHCPNCEAAAPFDDSQTADDARDAADPLQGAADWLVKSLDKPRPAEIAAHLLIGHNRAERLFDAAIAQQRKENGNEH